MREAAKNIKHDNWGVYQYWSETKEWTTEHKESSAQFPRLNADPITALELSKEAFEACPQVSTFSIKTSAGVTLRLDELCAVEWTDLSDMAIDPLPDRVDELEDQINELQEGKAATP